MATLALGGSDKEKAKPDKMEQYTHIALLDYPGAQAAALYGLSDLFLSAARLHAREREERAAALRVSLWSGAGTGRWAPGQGLSGEPEPPLTALLVPPSLEGERWRDEQADLPQWIAARHREGSLLCSVCAGTFLLAETGLLSGRSATTHWGLAEAFRDRYPEVDLAIEKMIVDEGDILTAGGLMAWVDLGLRLVERYLGQATLLATARFLLVDPGDREQRFYSRFAPRLDHGDAAILKAQHWLQTPEAERATVARMAETAGLGERTFLRRFQKATGLAPKAYLQHLRVARAQELLQRSGTTINAVAWQVGYEDPAAFRKVFQRIVGLSPGDYRRRFATGTG